LYPDPRLCCLSFEYPGSAGAGPWQRRNTTLSPGKGDLQWSKLEKKKNENAEKKRANEGTRYKFTKKKKKIRK